MTERRTTQKILKNTTMRKIFCLIIGTLTQLGCDQLTTSGNNNDHQNYGQKADTVTNVKVNQLQSSIHGNNLFKLSQAEKILGEPAYLKDSASSINADVSIYSCSFMADSTDQKSGKKGAIYFLFEQYNQVVSAKKKYSFIKTANENHEGIKVLHDIGDEAYFHSDNQNFYFIMVRKGAKVFNMKVNKITSKTSLDEFSSIAKNIADAL